MIQRLETTGPGALSPALFFYRLIDVFVEDYYHLERPHQGREGDTPILHQPQAPPAQSNKLVSIPILGGLHHKYRRVAA